MIEITHVTTLDGQVIDHKVPSKEDHSIDGTGLTLMPALIDPHVHFRTPGCEHKENWITASRAALAGGITTVFDMPNTLPLCVTLERVLEKKERIDKQLEEVKIPLRYHLYLGADRSHFDEIYKAKEEVIGLKVCMGSTTGDLLLDDESSLHAAFSLAAAHDLILAVHAEDEALIRKREALFKEDRSARVHSKIRNREVAFKATQRAIELAKIYGTRLYLCHISTQEELALIAETKKQGYSIFAEATPHHLFLSEEAYDTLGTKAQMNPPLRTPQDCEALWKAVQKGVIDTIGSDHAPHTLAEKSGGHAPSGVPGVETTLPLLLQASHEGLLSLKDIVRLMRTRIQEIFRLPSNEDFLLVDLNKVKKVEDSHLQTKCGWSPYSGRVLKGWPVCTCLKGKVFYYE